MHLFTRLLTLNDIGLLLENRHFAWGTFLLAVSLSASWQIAFGPYVADYSRYLSSNTSSWKTFTGRRPGNRARRPGVDDPGGVRRGVGGLSGCPGHPPNGTAIAPCCI